ncbi:MAG: hypothetical protein V7K27_08785 [Nostoc sp.]|uniref:5-methylcytosine restriction system specificity protein McrC n=1 Tax=Nostoc sp. TaxID=1180 RepID=UPI002FFB8EE7
MDNNQNLKPIFSCNPFEVIKQYKNMHKNKDNNIYTLQEFKDLLNTVKEPFANFCELIYQQIPDEIAAMNFYIITPARLLIEVDSNMLGSPPEFRLRMYLDIFSLLYIQLSSTDIKIKFIDFAGTFLARRIVEINPVMIANIIAEDVNAFDFKSQSNDSCDFTEKEILTFSKEELVNKFKKWFQHYLPFFLQAVSKEPIPAVSQYIHSSKPKYSLDLCSERVSPTVRKAYHALQGLVTLQPCSAKDCIAIQYNRLNPDYQLLHNLCLFFLENISPSHERGNYKTLPFLVDMAHLYELFVAEWLKKNTPQGYFFKQQHPIEISQNRHFNIDILLCDAATGKTIAVLDTKYKAPERGGYTDIHQMISYANTTKCKQAFLIYPKDLPQPLDIKSDQIQVRSLTFSLDDNLDRAGQTFLKNLFLFSEFPQNSYQ